jgi:hypothetical protein
MFLHNMYQSRVYLVRKHGVSNHPGLMCPLSDYATSVYVYGEAYITTAHMSTANKHCVQM